MNKNILIALIIIVLIILGGLMVFSHNNVKSDTQIKFLGNNTIKSGDSVNFELTDAQGKALSGKDVSIKFESPHGTEKYTIKTDSQGRGSLVVKNETAGQYNITVSFNGDDKYNSCSADKTINLIEGTSQNANNTASYQNSGSNTASDSSSSASSSSSSSGLSYDSELNVNYDSDGVIVGGQNDGLSYDYIKNNRPNVVDGNLEWLIDIQLILFFIFLTDFSKTLY